MYGMINGIFLNKFLDTLIKICYYSYIIDKGFLYKGNENESLSML